MKFKISSQEAQESAIKAGMPGNEAFFATPNVEKAKKEVSSFAIELLREIALLEGRLRELASNPYYAEAAKMAMQQLINGLRDPGFIADLEQLGRTHVEAWHTGAYEVALESSKSIRDVLDRATDINFKRDIAENINIGVTGPLTRLRRDLEEVKKEIVKIASGLTMGDWSFEDIATTALQLEKEGETGSSYKPLIDAVKKYMDLKVRLGTTLKDITNGAITLNETYEDLTYNMEKTVERTISGFVKDNAIKVLFTADSEAKEKHKNPCPKKENIFNDY
jgi:hypothetical protein